MENIQLDLVDQLKAMEEQNLNLETKISELQKLNE